MEMVINSALYFYFPQGEDSYFLFNVLQGLLITLNAENIEWEQFVSQTFIKSSWNA